MTAGPLSPIRACGVTISRVHRPAAMLIPPNDPTVPATTPMTGAERAQIQYGRTDLGDRVEPEVGLLQPDSAGLEQDHRGGRRARAGVRGGQQQRLRRSWRRTPRRCRRPGSPARWRRPPPGRPSTVPRAMTVPSSACGVMPCGASHGDSSRSKGPREHPSGARIEQRGGAAERVEFDEAAALQQLLPGLSGQQSGRSRCRLMTSGRPSCGGLGGLPQAQGDDAGCGAEVVEFPAPCQRGAGEEPFQHAHARRCRNRPRWCAPARWRCPAWSPSRGRLQQDLQIARADDADVHRARRRCRRREV